jgi:hypothetical protein
MKITSKYADGGFLTSLDN